MENQVGQPLGYCDECDRMRWLAVVWDDQAAIPHGRCRTCERGNEGGEMPAHEAARGGRGIEGAQMPAPPSPAARAEGGGGVLRNDSSQNFQQPRWAFPFPAVLGAGLRARLQQREGEQGC